MTSSTPSVIAKYVFYVVHSLHGKSCISQEEESFYQQIGLKFEEETSEVLRLEHGSVW